MLFMIIENFKDVAATGERFRSKGRLLPEGVKYLASWVKPGRDRRFQLMEAHHEESPQPLKGIRTSQTNFRRSRTFIFIWAHLLL